MGSERGMGVFKNRLGSSERERLMEEGTGRLVTG